MWCGVELPESFLSCRGDEPKVNQSLIVLVAGGDVKSYGEGIRQESEW
jgi:hypothetical protein